MLRTGYVLAVCKLELCGRDAAAGGPGDFDRVLLANGPVRSFVAGAEYADEFTDLAPPRRSRSQEAERGDEYR